MRAVEFGIMQPFGDISEEESKGSDGVQPGGYLSSIVILIEDWEECK